MFQSQIKLDNRTIDIFNLFSSKTCLTIFMYFRNKYKKLNDLYHDPFSHNLVMLTFLFAVFVSQQIAIDEIEFICDVQCTYDYNNVHTVPFSIHLALTTLDHLILYDSVAQR